MRRPVRIAGLAAALLVAALMLVACGVQKIDGMTATDIVAKSNAAMQDVKSAAIDGSLEITITGDKDKVGDPTSALLLCAPPSLTMNGVVSEEPVAMDMTIKVPLLAMVSPGTETIQERVIGDRIYLRFGEQWYGMKQPTTEPATPSPSPSVSTEQVLGTLKGLGVDIDAWVKDKQDLTAEQLDGQAVYHVSEEVDVDALADGVAKLLANAGSLQKLVPSEQSEVTQQQLDILKAQSGRVAESLKEYLRGATVDLWIEKGSLYLDKMAFSADIDLPDEAVEKGMSNLKLALSFALSRFDEPVQVEKPTDVKPLARALPGMWQTDGAAGGALLPGASQSF
jgi:hypothetical protein